MKKLLLMVTLVTTMFLTDGCKSVPKVIVTICDAEDAAMQVWADAHNLNKTSDSFDVTVQKAHQDFLVAKLAARNGVQAYLTNGDKASYIRALEAVRAAAKPVLDLISAITTADKSARLYKMLNTANSIGDK